MSHVSESNFKVSFLVPFYEAIKGTPPDRGARITSCQNRVERPTDEKRVGVDEEGISPDANQNC